ncbi:ABC transporter permease [Fulvivirgaceae bacterium BMA10]|uniref:ABC transporter permease n=1 Tax=Splendidivirga corallicola TaxID=3051826 RepID=A0ABT8KWY6_9BACT|nr:ABC transporter permease [Fulvivirgaceae bacterium BMA10]
MFKSYIISAFRNLLRHKLYGFINISGLILGIVSCMFIFLFVQNEKNYDKFHEKGDQIYRVLRESRDEGNVYKIGITSAPFATHLLTDFEGEILKTTHVLPNTGLVTYQDKSFNESKLFLVDSLFLEFFSYPLLYGDRKTALSEPNGLVIKKATAIKYFGDDNPIGKVVQLDNTIELKITGVLDDFPGNTHLDFDLLATTDLVKNRRWFGDWWSNGFITYVLIPEHKNHKEIETRFDWFMEKYFGDHFRNTGTKMGLSLEPLEDVYFNNEVGFDFAKHGDETMVVIFSIIAVFILVIACINFLNLSTASSASRALEVGIRKTSGALRYNLIQQFFIEAFLYSTIATLIAFLMVEVGLSLFNNFVGEDLSIPFDRLLYPGFAFILILIVSALSGLYPAVYLSSFQPATVLKGKSQTGKGGTFLRKGLVIFQFCISIILIIATIIVSAQLDFVNNKKLGFNKENIIILPLDNSDIRAKKETFKNRLENIVDVTSATFISGEPGGFHDNYSFTLPEEGKSNIRLRTVFTDHDYLRTFNIEVLEGRDFSEKRQTDFAEALLINEEAVKYLGWTNETAIGKEIQNNFLDSLPRQVIGVIDSYHFASLKNKIDPLIISLIEDHRAIAIKISTNTPKKVINQIESIWDNLVEKYPMEYKFLDQSFEALYQAEQKQKEIIILFSSIALFIACMGLFGLATFATQKRIKEIGIRKVLGARLVQLFILLSKDLLKLVMIASFIGIPLAWFAMEKWLENFVYRINIQLWMVLLAAIAAMFIALITVSYQSIKAGLNNPIHSLRNE